MSYFDECTIKRKYNFAPSILMAVNKYLATSIVAGISVVIIALALSNLSIAQEEHKQMSHDSATILLGYQRIRPGQFIHLYDTTPLRIASGHVAIHVDCNEDGVAPIKLALGVAPEMEQITLDMKNMIHDMSEHGSMCLYHLDIPPEHEMAVTDIAIVNTSNKWLRLGPESTVTIHIHELGEAVEEHHEGSSHSEEGSSGM